jgi:hypothetical protein
LRKLPVTAVAAGLLVGAFCWGKSLGQGPPPAGAKAGLAERVPLWASSSAEQDRAPVAWIYNSIPITRADLGEYLIARLGPERVELLVNRRIIDHECQAKGVVVTDEEVEAQLVEDLRSMGVTKIDDFVKQVLGRFNKTLYEYKEDVIRPKLAMIKLVRPTITITEQDLHDAFEANWGPKVHCRMIVLQPGLNIHQKQEIWERVRKSEEAFLQEARKQYIPALAAKEGDAPPIFHHFGDEQIEKAAFSLRPGEVSGLLDMKDHTSVILRCIDHQEADTTRVFENERVNLHKQVMQVRLLQEIPKYFKNLRTQADPRVFLRRDVTPEDVVHRAEAALRQSARQNQPAMPPAPPAAAATPAQGN